MELVAAALTMGLDPEHTQARGPRFVIFYNRGKADIINIMGGAKGLVDALVKQGVFIDDDPKHLIFAAALRAPVHTDKNIKATIYIGDAYDS